MEKEEKTNNLKKGNYMTINEILQEAIEKPENWFTEGPFRGGVNWNYIDADLYDDFPFDSLAGSLVDLESKYGKDVVEKWGYGPWAIDETCIRVIHMLKNKRWDEAIFHMSTLGHYISDIHVPFHVVENYKHFYSNEDDFIIKGWPNKTRFTAWSVIYEQGHQISHNHPDGWISGVFYLKVPDDLLDNEGSIEFSIHGYDHKIIHNNFENYTYKPKEGDLLLFPSSLYHKTIPYQSKKDRVVVAFDLCPA